MIAALAVLLYSWSWVLEELQDNVSYLVTKDFSQLFNRLHVFPAILLVTSALALLLINVYSAKQKKYSETGSALIGQMD